VALGVISSTVSSLPSSARDGDFLGSVIIIVQGTLYYIPKRTCAILLLDGTQAPSSGRLRDKAELTTIDVFGLLNSLLPSCLGFKSVHVYPVSAA
jgi:hypothetical protein